MNETEFLELWDACVKSAKPILDEYVQPTSMTTTIPEMGLDSLDTALTMALVAEVYGLTNEDSAQMPRGSLKTMYDWLQEHKTRDYDSVAEAIKVVA